MPDETYHGKYGGRLHFRYLQRRHRGLLQKLDGASRERREAKRSLRRLDGVEQGGRASGARIDEPARG